MFKSVLFISVKIAIILGLCKFRYRSNFDVKGPFYAHFALYQLYLSSATNMDMTLDNERAFQNSVITKKCH